MLRGKKGFEWTTVLIFWGAMELMKTIFIYTISLLSAYSLWGCKYCLLIGEKPGCQTKVLATLTRHQEEERQDKRRNWAVSHGRVRWRLFGYQITGFRWRVPQFLHDIMTSSLLHLLPPRHHLNTVHG